MAKQSGLGDALFVAGVDLSGDTQSVDSISGPMSPINVTSIDLSGMARIGGERDGQIDWTSFFDPTTSHPVLAALPTADEVVTYVRGKVLGNPAASLTGKQIDYAGTRANTGEFTFKVSAMANGFGLEWGQLVTPGIRTDVGATNGTSVDQAASSAFGGTLYAHLFALTGTDVTIKVQDSADNATFADVSGMSWLVNTTTPQAARVQLGVTATLRRYVRIATTTSGGFTNAQFAAMLVKNLTAVVF